jgi:hypothetical protein
VEQEQIVLQDQLQDAGGGGWSIMHLEQQEELVEQVVEEQVHSCS